jgi:transposase-like protein
MTESTATQTQPDATVTEITTGATRATWKQHGQPLSGFEFFGTEVKAPAAKGKAAKASTGPNGITVKGTNNREIATFAAATKFWAIVPADAPRQAPAKPKSTTPAAKAEPVVITAPIGGTQTVAPVKDAIDKAIKATGKSIMAISREHGLNPSQMRRLSLNQVAKVDLVRAEAIAKALGRPMADLFGGAVDKAKAAPKPEPKATGKGNRNDGASRKSKATRAADKLAADAEKLAQDQAAEATQDQPEGTEPQAADQAAE